jgi:hypothetical protein
MPQGSRRPAAIPIRPIGPCWRALERWAAWPPGTRASLLSRLGWAGRARRTTSGLRSIGWRRLAASESARARRSRRRPDGSAGSLLDDGRPPHREETWPRIAGLLPAPKTDPRIGLQHNVPRQFREGCAASEDEAVRTRHVTGNGAIHHHGCWRAVNVGDHEVEGVGLRCGRRRDCRASANWRRPVGKRGIRTCGQQNCQPERQPRARSREPTAHSGRGCAD